MNNGSLLPSAHFSDEWISVSHSKTLQSSPDYSLHDYVCL